MRAPDAAFRIGSDEFALVLTEIELDAVTPVVRRIAAHLAEVSTADGHAITASFGVAVFGGAVQDEETLLRSADAAMYAAKRAGEDVHLAA
jgi:diguanylate cyclase (GGDEF)-like protein